MKYILKLLVLFTVSCVKPDPNNLGTVKILPKGEYTIWNTGSRHIVKCLRPDGKYYWLNDNNFSRNGINGYDAHQYRNKTKIVIK